MKLKDKITLITGGTSGIGFAIAKRFSDEGAQVIITSDSDAGIEKAKEISETCLFIKTDVRDNEQIKNLVGSVIEKYGKLDIIVNSAGVYLFSQADITQMPLEDFDTTMDINFKGIFLMTKHVLPELVKTSGNIINIASALGLVPEKESPIYCASKAAVIMFSKATALQFPERGVRVNSICPGPVDTPMLHRAFPTQVEYDEYLTTNPMKRAAKPEEVANLALFLASDEASYITGGVYTIDGGESLK